MFICISYLNVPKHPQYWEFQIFFPQHELANMSSAVLRDQRAVAARALAPTGGRNFKYLDQLQRRLFLGASYCILQIQVECLCQVPLVWIILIFPHSPTLKWQFQQGYIYTVPVSDTAIDLSLCPASLIRNGTAGLLPRWALPMPGIKVRGCSWDIHGFGSTTMGFKKFKWADFGGRYRTLI